MNQILICLDFILPSLFFCLGCKIKGGRKKKIAEESLVVFVAALLFSPLVHLYFPLNLQAFYSAALMFVQFLLLTGACYKIEKIHKKRP